VSLLTRFDSAQIRAILRTSNYWSTFNRNDYPERIQDALNQLYRWIECPCEESCECKSFGCTHHWVRDNECGFEEHYNHFLSCYVDVRAHDSVRNGRRTGRGSNAVVATERLRQHWNEIQEGCRVEPKTSLICSNWQCEHLANIARTFRPSGENIYLSKWMSLLNMGVYVAYDNGSVSLLKRDYSNPANYQMLIERFRTDLISHMQQNQININDFLLLDGPSEFYNSIPQASHRPLGNILDKLYLVL